MSIASALVIGESLIDVLPGVGDLAGGSPMNVAVGLARLGRLTMLATWFGRDSHGQLIDDHLRASGVELVPGSDGAAHTSTAAVTFDEAGTAHYVFDLKWQMPAPPDGLAPVVAHTGSIGAALQPGADQALDALRRLKPRCMVSYDPNVRPQIIGPADGVRALTERFVGAADIVKASDEDMAWLYPHTDPHASARSWLGAGPSLVVLTKGAAGVTAMSHAATVDVPAPHVTLADTVGAGDSLMAALLDGVWSLGLLDANRRDDMASTPSSTLERLMRYASTAAGITLSRPGADPPWRAELPALRTPSGSATGA